MRRKPYIWTKEQKSIEEFFPSLQKTCFICPKLARFEIEDKYGKFTLCETHYKDLQPSITNKNKQTARLTKEAGEDVFSILEFLPSVQIKELKRRLYAKA